jgi:serine protease inhibitor
LSQKIVTLPFTINDAELYISISKKSKYLDTLLKIEQQFLSPDYQSWQKYLFEKYEQVAIKLKAP